MIWPGVWLRRGVAFSADGAAYFRMAAGHLVPSPYSRRWLAPRLFGAHVLRWVAATDIALLLTGPIAWWYFGAVGLVGGARVFAAALLCALPGVWRASWMFPVLTDAPSFALALAVAALAQSGHPGLAALLSLPLGATRESAPVFAALWSLSPWPLVGLLAVGWRRPSAPPDAPWLEHPIREALAIRGRIGPSGSLYLQPFGAALAGLAGAPSWQMVITVALAHAQLLVAQDAVRLTVWCAPVLVARAAHVIPSAWWALALLVTAIQRDDRV